ncbi:MAG: amidase family protein, partial [Deltaproteobacteria bacterium]|nr:amidase family protein [Deltaproteobacteria bacterium]
TLNFLEYAVPCYYIICSAEAASNLSRYDGIRYGFGGDSSVTDLDEFYFQVRSNGFGREVQRRILLGNFVLSAGYQGRYYQKALKVRRKIFLNFEKLFEHYAAFLLPTSPCPPVKIDDKQDVLQEYLMDIFTVTANLCGYPAVSFPAGFTHDNLPVGMQLVAPQFHEETLYKLCKIWERENSFHKAVPPLLIQ